VIYKYKKNGQETKLAGSNPLALLPNLTISK